MGERRWGDRSGKVYWTSTSRCGCPSRRIEPFRHNRSALLLCYCYCFDAAADTALATANESSINMNLSHYYSNNSKSLLRSIRIYYILLSFLPLFLVSNPARIFSPLRARDLCVRHGNRYKGECELLRGSTESWLTRHR